MTHLDFVSAKETLPRLASILNPWSKGFSFIIRQECLRPLAFARGYKKREARGDKKREARGDKKREARGDNKRKARGDIKREARGNNKREARGDIKRKARGDKKERLGVTTKERLGMRIKKERLEVIRIEKEKSNNKIKKGGSLRVCSRT
jgi:hypothetical protein